MRVLTVSVGDTAVSLHTLRLGGVLDYSKLKVPSSDQIFIFGKGGDSWQNEQKFRHAKLWKPCTADSLSQTTSVGD